MPADPVIISPPEHPLGALTTYELRDYQRDPETAIKGIAADARPRTPCAASSLKC